MDAVFSKIEESKLPLLRDKRTLGGGNCAFHAILQQGKRNGVELGVTNHAALRLQVCNLDQVLAYYDADRGLGRRSSSPCPRPFSQP